jgi:ferredoxin-NADP reductase
LETVPLLATTNLLKHPHHSDIVVLHGKRHYKDTTNIYALRRLLSKLPDTNKPGGSFEIQTP